MDYAIIIRLLREKLFLSQADLAEKLGISYVTVDRWENGHHKPTFKHTRLIVSLCSKFDTNISEAE